MCVSENFILEPVRFIQSSIFLFGSNNFNVEGLEIFDKKLALHLFLEQNLPENFSVWSDYFEHMTQEIFDHLLFHESELFITKKIQEHAQDHQKIMIKKRKLYLKFKKEKSNEYIDMIDFLNEVTDECARILKYVSIQRYILGNRKNSTLEVIFDIFNNGLMPCGYDKIQKKLVIYNPIELRSLYDKYKSII